MENEQPELIARSRKSKTPLIIGIVIAIHVVLIGSAFIIQEIHKRNSPPQQAAVDTEQTPLAGADVSPVQPMPDPMTMPPLAREPRRMETAALPPAPVAVVPKAKTETPAAKTKLVAKTYMVKKGDTWKSVSARLKVPVKQLAKDNKLDSKKFLKIGQKLAYKQATTVKPVEVASNLAKKGDKPAAEASLAPSAAISSVPAGDGTGHFVLYEVKKGDTLGGIAIRHAMRVAELRSANELKDDKIIVGQKLKVQQPGPRPAVQSLVADVEPRDSAPQIHVVSKGETVSELARRYGVTTSELLKTNNINDPTKVSVGQKLKIPSLEFPNSRADLKQVSSDQETLNPLLESATKI